MTVSLLNSWAWAACDSTIIKKQQEIPREGTQLSCLIFILNKDQSNNYKVLSFVSQCGHLWCRSRPFDCILLKSSSGDEVDWSCVTFLSTMLCCDWLVFNSCDWHISILAVWCANHSRASCFIRWRMISRPHRLKKTSTQYVVETLQSTSQVTTSWDKR